MPKKIPLISFLWGLFESTFFFIGPEVYTSRVALRFFRWALIACLCALLGECLGGSLLYLWAYNDPQLVQKSLVFLPGIDQSTLDLAIYLLQNSSHHAPLLSILFGSSFKVYLAAAGVAHFPLALILLLAAPPLFARYLLVSFIFWWIGQRYWKQWPLPKKQLSHALFWIAFYLIFFLSRAALFFIR
jgi:membrane protein YqaA with SNARE-associated domain